MEISLNLPKSTTEIFAELQRGIISILKKLSGAVVLLVQTEGGSTTELPTPTTDQLPPTKETPVIPGSDNAKQTPRV